MPDPLIWSAALTALDAARNTLDAGMVMPSMRNLQRAANLWREADRAPYPYREGTVAGAKRAVTPPEVVEVAGAGAATVATGGLASGGLSATSGAAAHAGKRTVSYPDLVRGIVGEYRKLGRQMPAGL